MPKATVAIEDRRFYQHGGVDVEGIARALWKNVSAGQVVEGGSTITQQLVRNLYIGREQTVERKLKEACLAIKLDKAWTKNRILATYMNQVYYGNLAYGIEAAAQTYFSKHASELTLPEAALLAGLPQAPSTTTRSSRDEVARAAATRCCRRCSTTGDITADAVPTGRSNAGSASSPASSTREIREPYFFSYVRDQLIAEYGAATVRSGGLKRLHDDRPAASSAPLRRRSRRRSTSRDDPAAALVSINPKNGAIRAMTAVMPGRARRTSSTSLSQARRQSGSTFKTFVLTAAVEQGINPDYDLLSLGAVPLPARSERRLRRRQLVVPGDLRPQLPRLDDDRTAPRSARTTPSTRS